MKKLNIKHVLQLFFVAVLSIGVLSGCKTKEETTSTTLTPLQTNETSEQTNETPKQPEETPDEKTKINIAVLKGPTGLGATELMEKNEKKQSANTYQFIVDTAPDAVVAKIVSGEVDIAAVPTNMASVIYHKTQGNVAVAAINTLGVLYLLENGNTIESIKDLENKTIYASGQGATPEYVLEYILKANEVLNVTVEYKTEHAELASLMASGQEQIVLLPEPNVTSVLEKSSGVRIALDMTEQWQNIEKSLGNEESQLAMGCIIVRKEFLENNKEAFDLFLEEYKKSIQFTNESVDEAAGLSEKFDIMPLEVAKKAIPNCNIVYMDGQEMKSALQGFYTVLFEANPKSIGGSLPEDDFYYEK